MEGMLTVSTGRSWHKAAPEQLKSMSFLRLLCRESSHSWVRNLLTANDYIVLEGDIWARPVPGFRFELLSELALWTSAFPEHTY